MEVGWKDVVDDEILAGRLEYLSCWARAAVWLHLDQGGLSIWAAW